MSAKRSPLAPLNRLEVGLRGTYDVIPQVKEILQGTYTKNSNCKAYGDAETVNQGARICKDQTCVKNRAEIVNPNSPRNERESSKSRFMLKAAPDVYPHKATGSKKQTELLKVLLGGSHLVLRNVSSVSSLKDYVQAMKSSLEECLGNEMFTTLYDYLCFDMQEDLSSEVDVSETLFEAFGEDGIVFVPLMLQFIRCENNL